jgi:drug/metabolite transporter (DMT)-like permease
LPLQPSSAVLATGRVGCDNSRSFVSPFFSVTAVSSPPSLVAHAGDRAAIRRGIALKIAAVTVFSVMDMTVKWLSARYPTVQIIFCRSFFAFIPLAFFLWKNGGLDLLKTNRPLGHFTRAAVGAGALYCFFWAFGRMPLADVVAIGFAAPLCMTAMSVWLLGERVGIRRWSAVAIGFAGVLLMVRPGASTVQTAALVALLGTLLYSLGIILVRKLSETERSATIVFYFTIGATVVFGAMLPAVWITPSGADAALLVLTGLLGGVGHLLITRAYQLAPIAVIAPFDYMAILWATGFGFVIFGDLPSWMTVVGALIVVGSGLYILHRETVRAREA